MQDSRGTMVEPENPELDRLGLQVLKELQVL